MKIDKSLLVDDRVGHYPITGGLHSQTNKTKENKMAVSLVANYDLARVTATGTTEPRALADRFVDVVNVKDFGAGSTGWVAK